MHRDFVEYCENKGMFTIKDFQFLIGAKKQDINMFFKQSGKKFLEQLVTKKAPQKIGIGTIALTAVKSTNEAKKISKEREMYS